MSHAAVHGCNAARRRTFRLDGLTLRALEWGAPGRPGLCLLHGGSAHAHWWDRVAPAFADRYHVLALDQRGHGESEWPTPPSGSTSYATEAFVGDLLGVMGVLGWERMALVGHSMGGHNAMAFGAWHPEHLWALVVVDSRPSIPPERLAAMHRRGHRGPRRHETLESAVRSFRLLPPETTADPALLEHLAREGIAERAGRFLYRFDPDCNGTRRPTDMWPLLGRITAPTLVVRGEHSPILPREMAREMAKRIPRARVEEIPGTHHHLVLDRPDAFVRILDDFLGGIPSA
ncbi:MAG TPA: alpha/beta hydrolase [Methylomirabilota bacterium]|nr:alpha/beta hydrolase [Methylomirabilota bacterium]